MGQMKDKPYLTPIKEGTAIDHLPVGSALRILELLKVEDNAVTLATNVWSEKFGKKDLMFIENKKLNAEELEKISLLARGGTLNIIEREKVTSKEKYVKS